MARVDINGTVVEFPDTLSPDELNNAVSAAASQMGGGAALADDRGMIRKGWDALAIPEQKSREGLQMLAGMVPNPEPKGNLALDIIRGTPKIAADTVAEAAPDFISPASLALAGAGQVGRLAKPIIKPVLQGLGRQGESVSGVVPGALEAAYKDSSLMMGQGKKAVQKMYETAKSTTGGMRKELQTIGDKKEFVTKALNLAEEGSLTPLEALEARKELVKIKKQLTGPYFQYAKDKLNSIAKTVFSGADTAYQKANMAESLRQIAPQNKYGGTSAFKMALQAMASNDGIAGKAVALGLSPFAQGTVATGAGMTARAVTNPKAASALGAILAQRRKKQ